MIQVDAYPMPRIDDILDQVGQARCITILDLKDIGRSLLQEKTVLKQPSSPLMDCINS